MSMMLAAGSGCGNQAAPASSQGSGGSVSAADNAAEAGADAPVRIAVAAPMTGDNAEYGIGFYNAATLMAEKWNAENPDKKVKLVLSNMAYDDMHNKLSLALESGEGAPDIVDIEQIGRAHV